MSSISTPAATMSERRIPWRVIAALNCVSGLAQIGQYGIAFVLFPLVLESHAASALHIGIVSSALWGGNLVGLALAPRFISRLGYRATVLCGLTLSSAALAVAPFVSRSSWALWAALSGMGYGLRWIGNETWLFGVSPAEAQGKIVGFHESLLAVAAVAGPALIAVTTGREELPFLGAAAVTISAAIPLWLAGRSRMPPPAAQSAASAERFYRSAFWLALLTLAPLVAGIGGLIEGGTISLFPVFASEVGLSTRDTAWTLSVFGLGAMLLQFPLGWLADARGVKVAVLFSAVATIACALALMMFTSAGVAFNALMFVLGGAVTGFLTLGIVAATRAEDTEALAAQISRVSMSFTMLSAVGPLLASGLVTIFGARAVMAFAALGAALALLPVAMRRR
jgi:MFS family permease